MCAQPSSSGSDQLGLDSPAIQFEKLSVSNLARANDSNNRAIMTRPLAWAVTPAGVAVRWDPANLPGGIPLHRRGRRTLDSPVTARWASPVRDAASGLSVKVIPTCSPTTT